MDCAAIDGSYCDLKFIRSRKVAQVVIEIPIEAASAFIAMFGAPDPAKECPVAIARLVTAVSKDDVTDKPRRHMSDMTLAEQIGIKCNEPAFRSFVEHRYGPQPKLAKMADECANFVRKFCGVKSRADIIAGTEAADLWKTLDDQYWCYCRGER